jgi:RNA polymerase sigma factor (sigma-70 family)
VVNRSIDFQQANRSALSIYTKYGNFILKIIHYHLEDKCQVDDIFQSFYLHLVINPPPADVERFDNYLHRTLVNFINQNARETKCYNSYLARYAKRKDFTKAQEDPRNMLISADQTSQLFVLIHKNLPYKESLAITLRYKYNYDLCEIGKVMHLKADSVRKYIARGINKLKMPGISEEMLTVSA